MSAGVGRDWSLEERRGRLEERASLIRSRLMRTVDALDLRRHRVSEVGDRLKRLALPVVGVAIGFAVLAAGGAFLLVRSIRNRRRRRREIGSRVNAALATLRPPKKASVFEDVVRRVVVTSLGVLAGEMARRAARNVVEGRLPDGRIVVTDAERAGREPRAR